MTAKLSIMLDWIVHKIPNIYHPVLDRMFIQSLANCPFSKEHSNGDMTLSFVHQALSLALRWKRGISTQVWLFEGSVAGDQQIDSEYLLCK